MFFLVVLIALSLCFYVALRGAEALFENRGLRLLWVAFVFLIASGIVLGNVFRTTEIGVIWRIVSTSFFVSLPYWTLAAAFFDALRFINKRRPFFPKFVRENYRKTKRILFAATAGIIGALFLYGYWKFDNPEITPLKIVIKKNGGDRKKLHAVVASDWHLGDIIGRERTRRYIEKINALKPDIILLPGDIVDSRLDILVENSMGEELEKLDAPLGVFAVTGNHERIANLENSSLFLRMHGIRVLRDEALLVDNSFYLVGRDDFSKTRPDAAKILTGVIREKPIIVLDHRPMKLEDAAGAGADFQLSGHTHNGQIWPLNWIVALLYEVPYGYGRHENLQIYVTSGLGLWGFPARIGTISEIVDLEIEFSGDAAD